jgi:hypothetical protein
MELRGDDKESLVIECSMRDDDILLNVTINVRGYSAADQAWVAAGDWHAFLKELYELERRRQGFATLTGADPHELKLVFQATDRAGHMAVTGFMGRQTSEDFYQKLEFGLSFDAGVLQTLVKELEKVGQQT